MGTHVDAELDVHVNVPLQGEASVVVGVVPLQGGASVLLVT